MGTWFFYSSLAGLMLKPAGLLDQRFMLTVSCCSNSDLSSFIHVWEKIWVKWTKTSRTDSALEFKQKSAFLRSTSLSLHASCERRDNSGYGTSTMCMGYCNQHPNIHWHSAQKHQKHCTNAPAVKNICASKKWIVRSGSVEHAGRLAHIWRTHLLV